MTGNESAGSTARPAITPEMKVGELLAHYPELEEDLMASSPAYQALKNPLLRRTVARLATLRQVAKVGDVPLGALITRLRGAAGLESGDLPADMAEPDGARPDWADSGAVWRTYDAREMIEAGGHPMERVMRDLAEMAPGQVYELITPFVPAPLIDLAEGRGFRAYVSQVAADPVRTYFARGE